MTRAGPIEKSSQIQRGNGVNRHIGEHKEITLDEHSGQHVRIFRVVMIVSVDV